MDLLWWRYAVSPAPGPPPVDRKHHVIVEAHGIPLAVTLTGGDRNDVTHLIPPVEAVAPIRGKRGRSLRRPKHLYADRGYDHDVCRDRVRRFEITPYIARRGTEHGSGLGVHRWVVEGAVALLHWFRRLRIRWEIRDDVHQAFITLGWVRHTLGLRANGTIVTVGNNADRQCEVDAWSGVQLP